MIKRTCLALLIFPLAFCGQPGGLACHQLMDKVPYLVRHAGPEANTDSLQLDFKILGQCGDMDEADLEMLTGPVLGTLLIELVTKEKTVTYRVLIEKIKEFKRSENYSSYREMALLLKTLGNTPMNPENWEEDKASLRKLGLSEKELDAFDAFIRNGSGQPMTYREAFAKFEASQPKPATPEKQSLPFEELSSLGQAMAAGKEKKKPVLIFFTGHACVNARKMEERVLAQDKVRSYLSTYYAGFAAYVDDKRPNEKGTNIGRENIDLQMNYFKSEYQPWFFIMDENGKVLADMGYTGDPDVFMRFLEKGRSER